VYLQFADEHGKGLNSPSRRNEIIRSVPAGQTKWKEMTLYGKAPEGAVGVTVWIHSFNGSKGEADLDDFQLVELTEEEVKKIPVQKRRRASRRRPFHALDAQRVAEIAAMLSPERKGLGRPAFEREVWDVLASMPEAARIIDSTENLIDTPPPEVPDELYLLFTKTGNRTAYQRPYGQRSGRIQRLLMAECLEHKGRFLKALERDVIAMCDERSWTMPAHDSGLANFNGTRLTIDLGSSARGWLLSTVEWWLGEGLAPEVRKRIRGEVHRRVLDVYMKAVQEEDTRGNWWMVGNNNWNAVCTAGVVCTALNLVESPEERARYLAAAELSNPHFLSGFTDDGYCSEGMGYWNYGFGHYMILGLAVREATGVKLDFFQGEKLARIAAYARAFQIEPGRCPWFADGGGNPSGRVWSVVRHVYPGAVPASFVPPSVLSGSHANVALRAFGQEPPAAPSAEKAVLPIRDWFGDAQILLSRGAPEAGVPFGAAIKGGHNAEHHNHNDVGSYTIMLCGEAFVLDPGGEVYTRRTFSSQRYVSKFLNSYGHPVPIVAGELQAKGRAAAARVLASEFSDAMDRLVLDISGAYSAPELEKLTRTFEHNRAERTITIADEFAFRSPQSFSTALPTYSRFVRRGGNVFLFYNARVCLQAEATLTGGEWDVQEETVENPHRKSLTRIGLSFQQPVQQGTVRLVFRPIPISTDLPGFYHEPVWGDATPQTEAAIAVEAEDFSSQTGGEVTVCEKVGASGRAFKFWDDKGHALEYTFGVAAAGTYAVQLRACGDHVNPITRKAWLDGKALGEGASFVFPDTGGWSSKQSDWRNVYLQLKGKAILVNLQPGEHVLRLENDCGIGLNLDWVRLVPVK